MEYAHFQVIRAINEGIEVVGGMGNFALCRLPSDCPDAAEVAQRCRSRGLFVRAVGGMRRELGRRALSVAVNDLKIQWRMIEALAWALAG